MATIKEVAKAAGVSVMTASRVARGMEGVRESTRKNVLEVMKNLGYQPNRLARALRNNHSNTIGIVVADVKNSFYMQVNALIEQRLRAKDFLCWYLLAMRIWKWKCRACQCYGEPGWMALSLHLCIEMIRR